jgi:hypothetical protein
MKILILSFLLTACSGEVSSPESPSCVTNTGITTCDQQNFYVYSETIGPDGVKKGDMGQCKLLGCAQGLYCIVSREDNSGTHFDEGHCK